MMKTKSKRIEARVKPDTLVLALTLTEIDPPLLTETDPPKFGGVALS
jgi:hypothetical protein